MSSSRNTYREEFPSLDSNFSSNRPAARSATGSDSRAQHGSPNGSNAFAVASSSRVPHVAGRVRGDVFPDDVGLKEDLGPRTLHRRAKPKPGIPFKVLKARNAENDSSDDEDGDPNAPIAILPPEILARVFAHLDPKSIVQCASACRSFSRVIGDDRTWRLAFSVAFGIEAHGLDSVARATPVLRRVDASSWRAEYIRRASLLRTWRRTRSPVVICDPRIGVIHAMAASLTHNFLLCGSENYGVATRCQPFTGKVSKGFVDSSGLANGVGAGALAMAAELAGLEVSCMRMEADAGRIVWGFHNGIVGLTTLGKQGADPRGLIRGNRFSPRDSHVGAVIDIAVPFATSRGGAHGIERNPEKIRQKQTSLGDAAETFVTAGIDGTIRLWSPHRPTPLWKGSVSDLQESSTERTSPVICVAYDVELGIVAAASLSGQVVLWSNIDIKSLVEVSPSAFEFEPQTIAPPPPAMLEARTELGRIVKDIRRHEIVSARPESDGTRTIKTLVVEPLDVRASTIRQEQAKDNERAVSVLVLRAGASSFDRFDLDPTLGPLAQICKTSFTCPRGAEITCLRPDFETTRSEPRHGVSTITVQAALSAPTDARVASQPRSIPLFSERRFVCGGTNDGHLAIWDWDQSASDNNIDARLYLDCHASSVTAIDSTEHAIILGFADGTVKAFCPLTGQLLRTLNDKAASRHPARMLAAGDLSADDAARFTVSQIIAGPDVLIASIGSQVLSWRPEPPRTKANARKATSRTGRASVGRLWDPKMQSKKEMERDVYETRQELDKEHQERLDAFYRVGAHSRSELDGLTEEEMFAYAMMLSRDEANGSAQSRPRVSSSAANEEENTFELRETLDQIAAMEASAEMSYRDSRRPSDTDMSDGDTFEEQSYTRQSSNSRLASPNLPPMTSPPSRAWDILQSAGPSASRNARVGDSHSKVQSVHVPQSARLSHNSSRRPSMSPGLHAQGSQQNLPTLSSPLDWPSFDLSSSGPGHSPSRLDLDSTVPRSYPRQTSNNFATTDTGMTPHFASPSPSSHSRQSYLGAWAAGSPALRPASDQEQISHTRWEKDETRQKSRSPASHSHNEEVRTSARDRQAEDDADLRFALELSLAEEESRQQASSSQKQMQ